MTFKTLAECLAEAPRDKAGEVKYPLDCGCKSPHEHNMCVGHQQEKLEDQRRRMGIADLRFTSWDFLDLPKLAETLTKIKVQLVSNPTKACLIYIIPGEKKHEADASSRD